jgi:organic radical activating enzyme
MIKYKGIIHNVLNDAPFIGALIIAPTCSKGCKNCINEHLKTNGVFYNHTEKEIIEKVKSNGLNRGIILSGLEWSESLESMIKLTKEALKNNLEVIIYTHLKEENFMKKAPGLKGLPIYVKFGEYNQNLKTEDNIHFGVKLATRNQYIRFLKISSQMLSNYWTLSL